MPNYSLFAQWSNGVVHVYDVPPRPAHGPPTMWLGHLAADFFARVCLFAPDGETLCEVIVYGTEVPNIKLLVKEQP